MKPWIMAAATLAAQGLAFSAFAQDAAKIAERMNASDLCKPLKVAGKDYGGLVPGLPAKLVALLAAKGDIGVDTNAHEVKALTPTSTGFKIDGTFGCEPSDKGLLTELGGIPPKDMRITDNFTCEVTVTSGQATAATCTTSGEFGKLLAKVTKVDEQMLAIIQAAMKPA